jgi:hypothetical protein
MKGKKPYLCSKVVFLFSADRQGCNTAYNIYLGNFWLIRGILCGPARVLEDVAEDCVRDAGVVVPHSEVGTPDLRNIFDNSIL